MRSNRNLIIVLMVLLIFLCAVLVNILTGGGVTLFISSFSDVSPPHVTFTFTDEEGRLSIGTIVAEHGEPFTPLIDVHDDCDPSPTVDAWISQVDRGAFDRNIDEEASDPVIIGEPMSIAASGLYSLFVRVTDKAGNSMVYSTIINIHNKHNQDSPL